MEWARRQLQERGAYLVIGIRPIPGARTAVTLAAGMLGMPWRRFLAADAVAAVIWGGNEVLLGYAGGNTFEHSLWLPLLAGLRSRPCSQRPASSCTAGAAGASHALRRQ